jgi:hypothetical protein
MDRKENPNPVGGVEREELARAIVTGRFYVQRWPAWTELWLPSYVTEKLGEKVVRELARGIYSTEFVRPEIILKKSPKGIFFLCLPSSRDSVHPERNYPDCAENPRYDLPDKLVKKLGDAIEQVSAGIF